MEHDETASKQFDFPTHERAAISAYLPVQPFYVDLANVLARIVEQCLKKRNIKVHRVEYRAKDPGSFGRKSGTPSETDPNSPKYPEPLKQITDLAGVRIIAYFPKTVTDINSLINDEFEIVEQFDKGQELIEEERFGYQSVHYLVRLKPERVRLAEYERFANAVAEVQVRTILQHAWAEIEHDIQYKSSTTIPKEIRRRFMVLAGMLELADREFQDIQNQDRNLAVLTKEKVLRGDLTGVEITPDALKLFLDKKLGGDERIRDWGYLWTALLLSDLGFRDLKQVETAIAPYDDDELSSIAFGSRQGQITRFELMLLAALGERFIERHRWKNESWFEPGRRSKLALLREKGIQTSTYDPLADSVATTAAVRSSEPVPTAGSDTSNTP
jgi:putative GTP pyrophosphokinase